LHEHEWRFPRKRHHGRRSGTEQKYEANIKKHGIDFRDAQEIFKSIRLSYEDKRKEYQEKRIITVGMIDTSVRVVL
jgi:uncharacterized DUF497 family protein